MYIALDVSDRRYEEYEEYGICKTQFFSTLPKPEFMPTKLVRTSNMEVINGSDVNEGYCALSYSWNQSGEILRDDTTGKYNRIDEGKHEIISYDNNIFPSIVIPYYKTICHKKLEKIYEVLNIMEENKYCFTKTTRYVKFEGIIRKICQKFNIKYLWYDQMCINQDDKEEKHREIRNMHHIYGNAYCTVAVVPELTFNSSIRLGYNNEEYFKRLWTLEEAMKSERLLFVGRDGYKWGDNILPGMDARILSKTLSELNVAQILHHAHKRTSTKEHDRVFALIQLFPEFMEHINIDYNQPFEKLMIRFYGLLAKKDISILLFENSIGYPPYNSTIQKYKFLPSWTGVNGEHMTEDVTTSFQNYNIIGKTMNVTSKFVTSAQPIDNDALTIQKEDLPPPPGDINDGDNKRFYCLCISVQLPGSSEARNVSLRNIVVIEECFDEISKELKRLSKFMVTKKESLYWCHSKREEYQKVIHINFDNLTEDVDNLSAQYIILSEVSFKEDKYNYLYYPVIKKKQGEEYYKAIGCCRIEGKEDYFSDCNLPKQIFSIQ